MIGQRLEARGGVPWGAILLLLVGLGLGTVAWLQGSAEWALAAVLPCAWSVALWLLGRERPFTATIHEDAIEIEDPPARVPFASLRDVRAGGQAPDPSEFRKSSCPLGVWHEGGLLRIPARLNVPAHELYGFLAGRVPAQGGRDVNPALAEYLDRQERYFGPGSVWTYRAASHLGRRGEHRGIRAFAAGLLVTGAVWMALGFSEVVSTGWGGAGIPIAVFGGLLLATTYAESVSSLPRIKNWKKASLVISPQGMAMVQGEIQGEVHWPELLDVRYRARPRSFTFDRAGLRGILIRVKGADIIIADIYDRPLYVIHAQILASSGRASPFAPEL